MPRLSSSLHSNSSHSSYPKKARNGRRPVVTKGILSLIDKIGIPNTIFCRGPSSVSLTHFEQQDEWSCGYRNLQMLLSSITPNVPRNHPLFLFNNNREKVPTTLELQQLFEMSWNEGFDREGAAFFNHRLLGTHSEIGAVEVASLLSFLYIDNVVVQFEKSQRFSWDLVGKFAWHYFSKPYHNGCESDSMSYCESVLDNVRQVLNSMEKYGHDCTLDKSQSSTNSSDTSSLSSFSSSCNFMNLPLYLQWNGHSATIIGVEKTVVRRNLQNYNMGARLQQYNFHEEVKYNLLVFDPSKELVSLNAGLKIAMKLKQFNSDIIRPLRFPFKNISGNRCQIIACSTQPLTFSQRNKSKTSWNAVAAVNA